MLCCFVHAFRTSAAVDLPQHQPFRSRRRTVPICLELRPRQNNSPLLRHFRLLPRPLHLLLLPMDTTEVHRWYPFRARRIRGVPLVIRTAVPLLLLPVDRFKVCPPPIRMAPLLNLLLPWDTVLLMLQHKIPLVPALVGRLPLRQLSTRTVLPHRNNNNGSNSNHLMRHHSPVPLRELLRIILRQRRLRALDLPHLWPNRLGQWEVVVLFLHPHPFL